MRLSSCPFQLTRTAWALIVMPRSRSRSIESSTCSRMSRSATEPVSWRMRSASVDFPWPMWAMIEKLRMRDWSMRGVDRSWMQGLPPPRRTLSPARRAGYGARRAEEKLRTRGVEQELARSAVAEIFGEEAEQVLRRARAALGARYRLPEERQKAFAFLCRRGFSVDVARRAVEPAAG